MQRLFTIGLAAKLTLMSLVLFLLIGIVGLFTADRALRQMMDFQLSERMQTSARVSANDTRANFPDMAFTVDAAGDVVDVRWDSIPDIDNHAVVDAITLQTEAYFSVLRWDPARDDFIRLTTSLHDAQGTRQVGTPLGKDHPARDAILSGKPFVGHAEMFGASYAVNLRPVLNAAGQVVGILCNFLPEDAGLGVLAAGRKAIAVSMGLALIIGMAVLGLGNRWMLAPLGGLQRVMDRIRAGQVDGDIPAVARKDEIGGFARGIDAWRGSLLETQAMAEHDRLREVEQTHVVAELTRALGRLAALDLTSTIDDPADNPFPARYQDLRQNFNAVVQTLAATIEMIRRTAQSIDSGSTEFNGIAQDLSNRTETQAATLEQTAAALDEMTASVQSTAGNAADADRAMTESGRQAQEGGQVVRRAITAMEAIEQSSRQITRITDVIDDIAFQTNLLALNAGVEAARAGDAGKGFAVVASEVRSLAQRASESAKEIKRLITQSTEQVENGSSLVHATGQALDDMIARIGNVTGLIADIANSAREQSLGLTEINVGVKQLDEVTQRNAAVVVQSTQSAESLHNDALRLSEALSQFKLANAGAAPRMAAPRMAPSAIPAPAPRPAAVSDRPVAARATGTGGSMAQWEDF